MNHIPFIPILWITFAVYQFIFGNLRFFRFSRMYEKRTGKYMCDNFILWFPQRQKEFLEKFHDDDELIAAFMQLKNSYRRMIFGFIVIAIIGIISLHEQPQ